MIVTVHFEVEVPDDVNDCQLEKWLEFELGARCDLDGDNPMAMTELQAEVGSVRIY